MPVFLPHHSKVLVLAVVVTSLIACSDEPVEIEATGPTYHDEIEGIVADNCAECHHPDESAPIDLHTYEDLRDNADVSLSMIKSGEMPPWPPDPECREYEDQRVMADEEIEVFEDWVDGDTPRGEAPEDYEPFAPPGLPEADIRAGLPEPPYYPKEDVDDEYRCFLLETEFDDTTYMEGIHVDTGGKEVIHHATVFVAPPHVIGGVQDLEAGAEGSGYPCYGGPGFDNIDILGSWVPGVQPIFAPENSGVRIREGSRLVMQIHFNTLFADPEPVAPEVMLYTRDEQPEYELDARPFGIFDFVIPPGDRESSHTDEFTNRTDETWKVLGAAPHMHELGTRVHSEVLHDDGSKSCLVDIPDWDFDWQQQYRFRDDEWIEVQPGETVRLTCEFDNSADNQPIIDGERQEPREVTWGPGTTDEMCLNFLVVRQEYEPLVSSRLCGGFDECRDDCEDPSSMDCLLDCGTDDFDCGVCLMTEVQNCAEEFCPAEVDAIQGCLISCGQEVAAGAGDFTACMDEECPDDSDEFEECMEPRIAGGYCNEYFEDCNIEY